MLLGSMNRLGAVPAFLRTPTMIPPPLDMKQFLQFPMDTAPPQHSMGLFHNFNTNSYSTMDPVQKAVMNHTFGPPMMKTKRPIISCNVCQIRFNSESQAEAHYKGNRHARRVKGIETSKTRPQEGDKPAAPPTASPSPPGPSPSSPGPDPSKQDDVQSRPHSNGSDVTPSPIPMFVPDTPLLPVCPSLPPLSTPMPTTSTPFPALCAPQVDTPMAGPPDTPSPAPSLSSGESEEDKAKKLLYCSLCKVAVNSLSQLEAHNKGTKHKTILEAWSGLGPIKAYPRLCPNLSPEQAGGLPSDHNTQERTFHCEICNVRVNSELQLKQHISSRRHRDGVAGKPNPLLSRHKNRTDFVSSFSKELPKTLGHGLLPNPLAVAVAMAAAASSNQLAQLRAPGPISHPQNYHPHHHLLQGTLQGTHLRLLRPAPGPMRTTHGPILFSPY
ncbi:zinc finger protein 385A-like [Coregonus clupeaformis]|uniref:zinc finger protein 385A-like n=1 Tax=Coregonus clupeaformis TaxID=59861 RepID=UPI001E1C4AE3|nr:zinc finger protein 385A-like [Coregonus clupeaformis]